MVAAGLGLAIVPKGVALPLVRAKALQWRALSDAWATRQVQLCVRTDADLAVKELRDFLRSSSQNAKTRQARLK
jgi:DNA-binding transcriptional LysR family regulator